MNNTAGRQPRGRAEREAEQRSQRRAEQAGIVTALKSVLEADEQLLGFARARIAGGFRGKLSVGPEALFAPMVNIGLTERRLVLQHIHTENGRPSPILPHFFALSQIESLTFSDIETYGGDPACRLVVRMNDQLNCRLRLRGQLNFESAESIAVVFNSLTGGRRGTTTPTQRGCTQCRRVLDQPYKFCPYCGQEQPEETHAASVADSGQPETETPVSSEQPVSAAASPLGAGEETGYDEAAAEFAPEMSMDESSASPPPFAEPAAEAERDPEESTAQWSAHPITDDQPEESLGRALGADSAEEGSAQASATSESAVDSVDAHDAATQPAPDEENIGYHDDTLSQGEF